MTRQTSPCDGTTCLHVTVVDGGEDHHEHGEPLHTHRGDPYWFDTSGAFYDDEPPRHLRAVPS